MRHVFVDESCQNAHQFMVLGALVLPGQLVTSAEIAADRFLLEQGMSAELKWTKVSRTKLAAYRGLIDLYFEKLVPAGAEFHALVVNCHGLDHRTYNQGEPDLGFNKFVYQLLLNRVGRPYGENERVVVDLDARNSTRDVRELQNVLNSAMARVTGRSMQPPFARLAHRDSRSTRLLQLVDLLAGAVAWHRNNHDAHPGSSAAKAQLADYTAAKVGRRRLGIDTSRQERRLGVWNFRLQPRQRGGRPAT